MYFARSETNTLLCSPIYKPSPNRKLYILVLDTYADEYQPLKKAILRTWAQKIKLYANIRVIFYRGNPFCGSAVLDDQTLTLPCGDSLVQTSYKLFLALKWIAANEEDAFDIYRTNLSSFLFVDQFLLAYNNLAALQGPFYSGVIGHYSRQRTLRNILRKPKALLCDGVLPRSFSFCSGSGFFLSYELIAKLLSFRILFERNIFIDDVAVGYFYNSINNECCLVPQSRFDIFDDSIHSSMQRFVTLCKYWPDIFHVRVKGKNKLKDSAIMQLMAQYESMQAFLEQLT